MSKVFAPGFEQDEYGWYHFPSDSSYRKSFFPEAKGSDHPARANMYLIEECVKYVSEPEQTVCDIMAGSGTILIAAKHNRSVVMFEIEKAFQELIQYNIAYMLNHFDHMADRLTLIPGNCEKLLPIPIFDHVIYSPPYSTVMKLRSKQSMDTLTAESYGDAITNYCKTPENLGNYTEFMYFEKIEKIHKKVLESLPSGGTLTIIIKDHIRDDQRVELGARVHRDCIRLGFRPYSWFKWKAPGTAYQAIKRAQGQVLVEDEDVITVQKP